MAIKYPIEYELAPMNIYPGMHWLTLTLKNIGAQDLTSLDLRLNSLDAYSISVSGTGLYIVALRPNEQTRRAFQVRANLTGRLYASLDGWQNGESFHWESPAILVTVGREEAKLVSLFAMTKPYPPLGEKIRCEAAIQGLAKSEGLNLEFWAVTPGGEFEELAIVEIKELSTGEEARYAAEVTPEEEGLYTIHAYLYDGIRRIGHQVEKIFVKKA